MPPDKLLPLRACPIKYPIIKDSRNGPMSVGSLELSAHYDLDAVLAPNLQSESGQLVITVRSIDLKLYLLILSQEL